jgi:predicted dehydrogenase
MVLSALNAGKDVFVEKPLTLDPADLDQLRVFYETQNNPPLLMTGYNRRFSPATKRVREILQNRVAPMIVNYRMNAGYLPPEHWVHSPEGGGRNLGEACHIYDLFNFLTGSSVRAIQAASITPTSNQYFKSDNFVATISYEDGSVCTLTYTALGSKSHPKESMEIFCDGKVLSMIDYKSVTVAGSKQRGWKSLTQQKGHFEEIQALARALRNHSEWPITLEDQIQAARIAFEVERQIADNQEATFAASG